jgi:immune inhibitor A
VLLLLVGSGVCGAAPPAVGDLPVLLVRASFPDRTLEHDADYFTSLMDRLTHYYAEASSGRLRIVPLLAETVVTLPEARARYVGRPSVLAGDAARAFVAAASAEDRALLERARALIVFFAGPGRESHVEGGDAGDPWSNYTVLVPPVDRFNDAVVISEKEVEPFSPFGVLCHEFGHLLGLPELYAPGAAKHEGIGVWGLMGQGTWLGHGDRPPQPEAWSKMHLGWVDVETIDRSTLGVTLPAVNRTPRVLKIPAAPGNPQEYYLLENRLREGADARLPGEGLLIWHVDERVNGFRTAQQNPAHKMLHLVEADGRGDLDRGHAAGGNRGDAGDPWSGPPAWRRRAGAALAILGALVLAAAILRLGRPRALVPVLALAAGGAALLAAGAALRRGPVCGTETPGMAPYAGGPSRVVIRNLSPPGPEMRFDVLVAPPDAPPDAAP